jgi:DNA-directed RNA polymerase I subunit RPA2
VLLGGHLYLMILREQVEGVLQSIRGRMLKDAGGKGEPLSLRQVEYIKKVVEGGQTVGARMTSFLSTGTIKSVSGLDLMQDKGFVVMADKLNNFRFLSHFRSVHRGAYFAEMKTTTVRKLLPESWGFLCPVHTPDGAPCGLLNHITIHCRPLARHVEADLNSLELTLFELGLR